MRRKSTYVCLVILAGSLCACATQQTVQSTAPVSQAAECEKWVQAAGNGDATSQLNAGVCYQYGQLGEPDYVKAADWYRRAALQGNMRAETNLGWLYDNGMGVAKDFSQARYWYEKAAAQGESNAEDDLGLFYEYGKSVPKNYATAVAYFQKAADQGNTDAEDNLSYMYEHGEGVARNYSTAIMWMRMAALYGDLGAQQQLPGLYRTPGAVQLDKDQTILDWARAGAQQGSPDLEDFLGENYEFGWYTKIDKQKAVLWYTKSAQEGYAQGEFHLGNAYFFGKLTPKNYPLAMKWFRLAAAQNYAPAENNIGVMYRHGDGVPVNVTKAAYWYRKAAPEITRSECNLLELHFIGAISASSDEVSYWQSDTGPSCQNQLAWDLSTSNLPGYSHPHKALTLIQLAISKDPESWNYRDTFAAVYAALGEFPQATKQENLAILLAQKDDSGAAKKDIDGLKKRLDLYDSGKAYRSHD